MKATLIGCGCGSLTREAEQAVQRAQLLIGSARLLRAYGAGKPCAEAVTAERIAALLRERACEETCVLFSGDSGFYSGARSLLPLLEGVETVLLPGVSSVQLLAARLKRPWQDWRLCSAHGQPCDAVEAVCGGRPAFFLTGGQRDAAALCRELTEAGLGFLRCAVGEALGTPDERVSEGSAQEFSARRFAPQSVLLAEAAPRPPRRAPGLPDDAFLRAPGIPMTKQELRAAALGKLAVGAGDCCWDIGAGTGSVSVELALQCRAVWGVERDADALALAEQNRRKHGAWNLRLVAGEAPAALAGLPAPDAVFVGGSGGRLREILQAVHDRNPAARVCVAAIAVETLQEGYAALRALGYRVELAQLAVSRGREAGSLTLMLAQNPVWLLSGSAP